jgi:hypothetical protein
MRGLFAVKRRFSEEAGEGRIIKVFLHLKYGPIDLISLHTPGSISTPPVPAFQLLDLVPSVRDFPLSFPLRRYVH